MRGNYADPESPHGAALRCYLQVQAHGSQHRKDGRKVRQSITAESPVMLVRCSPASLAISETLKSVSALPISRQIV